MLSVHQPSTNQPSIVDYSMDNFVVSEISSNSSTVERLPDEVWIHVFAQLLDPDQLNRCSLVCRRWQRILNDDLCWKEAFRRFWGSLPHRSLTRSWKNEYTLRTQLVRIWKSGKSQNVLFEPRIGPILDLDVHFDHARLFVGSREQGVIALCDPNTGRVDKDIVYLNPSQSAGPVTALSLNAHRALVGHTNGSVSVVSSIKDGGSGCRRRILEFAHSAAVSFVISIQARDGSDQMYLTCSQDGQILFSDCTSGRLVGAFDARGEVLDLVYDQKANLLMVLNALGIVHIWVDPELKLATSTLIPLPSRLSFKLDTLPAGYMNKTLKLFYDQWSKTIFVADGRQIKVMDALSGRCLGCLAGNQLQHLTNISCMTWDSDGILVEANDAIHERRLCLVVSGDTYGDLFMWDCRPLVEQIAAYRKSNDSMSNFKMSHVSPLKKLSGHTGAISCLQIDAFKVTSASTDSFLRVWDILTGKCLRVMSSRYFRYQDTAATRRRLGDRVENRRPEEADEAAQQHFDPENRRLIHTLVITLHRIVISVGNEIKTWDFDPDLQLEKFRGSRKRKPAGKQKKKMGIAPMSPRVSLQVDVKRDLKESNRALIREREEREAREKLANKLNPKGLTEDELLQYAMLISMEGSSPKQGAQSSYSGQLFPKSPVSPAYPGIPFVEKISSSPGQEALKLSAVSLDDQSFPALGKSQPGSLNTKSGLSLMSQKLKGAAPSVQESSVSVSGTSASQNQTGSSSSHASQKSRTVSKPIEISSPSKRDSELSITTSSRPPSYPRTSDRPGFASPSSRPRKMSLNEFMANDILGSPTSGIPVFPASTSLSSYSTSPIGSLGTTSIGVQRPSWQSDTKARPRGADDVEEQTVEDEDSVEIPDEEYFSKLHDPRGLGDGRSGGGTGSSHSGFRRHFDSVGQNWSSVQVVPHPSTSQEEEELQYALELSLLEQ